MSLALQSQTAVRARNLPVGSSSRTAQPKSQVDGYSALPRKPDAGQPDLPQCMRPWQVSERSSAHAAWKSWFTASKLRYLTGGKQHR
jgi:hypothetical protein